MAVNIARKYAIAGAGWAGCAAAVELSRNGHHVSLFEASRTLGGRARRVDLNGMQLDNGQHILLGAYTQTLQLMDLLGIDSSAALLRLPLQMRYPKNSGGMDFVAARLPAPLHLLAALWRADGLNKDDKLALVRFSTTAKWMDWRLNDDCSVSELLHRFDQTDRLIKLMWRPLCIAALNTPPDRASAQVFLAVLHDSLGAGRAASDMLIPKLDLSALLPEKAAAYVVQNKGAVHTGANVKKLTQHGAQWQLEVSGGDVGDTRFDGVIIATQPSHVLGLLDGLTDIPALGAFSYEPITTCYLQYAPAVGLDRPFYALIDGEQDVIVGSPGEHTEKNWGQFVFDRGQIDRRQAGLLAVVISASTDAMALGHERLAAEVARQLAGALQSEQLANPTWTKIISEKQATFSCTPGLIRPNNSTELAGLFLAGDYTEGAYPATLESAVRSGVNAAKLLLRSPPNPQ